MVGQSGLMLWLNTLFLLLCICTFLENMDIMNTNWSIVPSPGDGHCLLYSVNTAWRDQLINRRQVDLNQLKQDIFIETFKHADEYKSFMQPSTSHVLFSQMESYLLKKQYNTCYGDLVPAIIANAENVTLAIYNELNDGNFHQINIEPRQGHSDVLYLHRKREHYNAVSLTKQNRKIVKYTSEKLKSL